MKSILLSFVFFAVAGMAHANSIYCVSKYFSGNAVKSVLKAEIVSSKKIGNVVFLIDGDVIFTAAALTQDANYRPTQAYANYISVIGNKKYNTRDTYSITKVLLERDFSEKEKFRAVIAEQAADGGSYNHFYCYNNK